MPHREHEAVTVSPDRVVRIEAQLPLPERIDDGRQGHWRPRVAGVGLLNGVHRERADRVDAELVQFGAHCWLLSTAGCFTRPPPEAWPGWTESAGTAPDPCQDQTSERTIAVQLERVSATN